MSEVILRNKTFELRADFLALERLELYFPVGWKWFRETPRIFAEGATIKEAVNYFRALVVVPEGETRPTHVDVQALFSEKLMAYVEAFNACTVAINDAMPKAAPGAKTEEDADPQ